MLKITILLFIISFNLFAKQNCISCHPKEAKKCEKSNHTTLKNAINITRKAWGIKDSNVTLQTLPLPKIDIKKPSDLVDDFLRRKCLKCHLGVTNSGEKGSKRGKSCLACHYKHQTEGKCQPIKISNGKCLSCHNKSFVGADYLGLFPKDHSHSYRAPLRDNGNYPNKRYGIDFHHLNEDIHYKTGMKCTDCHKGENWEKKLTCKECHKNPSKSNHPIYHKNISCNACHSLWNTNSYELSVFRDDTKDYKKWKDLILQEDGYLSKFLTKALKNPSLKPKMPDWIEMKLKDGIWYSGWRYRRWEDFVLVNNKDGKIKIARPLFQYRISYRNKNGKMVLDDISQINGKKIEVWLPYSPHTISKRAKSCEMCHNNPLLFQKETKNEILNLKIPKNIAEGTPLTKQQLKRLKSEKYKKTRAKMLLNQ